MTRNPGWLSVLNFAAISFALTLNGCEAEETDALRPPELYATDLEGKTVFPLRDGSEELVLLIFTRTDCPISNRYAPEVQRLDQRFAPLGVELILVYADPVEPADAIQKHLDEFGYQCRVVRDVDQLLVRRTGVKVTPEAALLTRAGRLLYRGRIDDRFPGYGMARQEPRHRDLQDALVAATGGARVRTPRTDAVGCFIPDRRVDGDG